jgi:hypothetical protein
MHRFAGWRKTLSAAATEQQLAARVNDWVNSIPPEQLARLPERVRNVLLNEAAHDIEGAAVSLLQYELTFSGDAEMAAMLHEVAYTCAAASIRLGQLRGREQAIPSTD